MKEFENLHLLKEQADLANEVRNKELRLRKAKADSQLDRMSNIDAILNADITGDTDYDALSQAATLDSIQREHAISFPTPSVSEIVFLGPGSLATFLASTGTGKCFAKDTEILMFDGSIKHVQDVVVGDLVMGADSTPRTVLSTTSGVEEMFKVSPTKGDPYIVNKSHILSLKWTSSKKEYKEYSQGDVINLSMEDYLSRPKGFKHNTKGYRVGVNFASKAVPVDPYLIGFWLGDGCSSSTRFVTADTEAVERIKKAVAQLNINSDEQLLVKAQEAKGKATTYAITGYSRKENSNKFLNALKELDLLNNKHIPDLYKINSRDVRLSILAGLIDSDGSLSKRDKCVDFCLKSKRLADDLVYLSRSLGLAAYIKPVKKMCCNSITRAVGLYYRVSISGNISEIPCSIPRKQCAVRSQIKDVLHVGIKVSSEGQGEYYGFSVDGDHLFLLSDFTVVHNSTFVSNAVYQLVFNQGKKVAIIVNEEQAKHVAARISCLQLGYSIHKYMKNSASGYPDIIKKEINDNFVSLKDKIAIIDQHSYGVDMVRSIEGMQKLVTSLYKKYDAIFIDYYQNIDRSIQDPSMDSWSAQERFANFIDTAKNDAIGPIILMAQVKKGQDDFEQRMKGRKLIVDKSTDVFEMVIEKDKLRTHVDVLKDRWLGNQGERRTMGYEDGRYIEYSREFENKIKDMHAAQLDLMVAKQQDDGDDD